MITKKRWHPHLVVATIIESDGKFLMIEEISDGLKVFNQPAGHVEENETLLAAALRETLEETAWEVDLTGITGFYQYHSPHNGVTYFRCCFHGKAISQTNSELDQGIIDARWMTYEEISQAKEQLRSPLVLKCLDDYLQGQRFPLNSVSYFL